MDDPVTTMQSRAQKLSDELEALEIEGEAGGGLVKVTINAKFDARRVRIDPSLLKPDDVASLQDLLVAALLEAKAKGDRIVNAKMQQFANGLVMPGIG